MFQEQLKHLSRGEFTLGISDLEKLNDQMQRCWAYVKQTANTVLAARAAAASAVDTAQMNAVASTSTQQARIATDPFSLIAQENTGLRVEDLKPPPMKQRRSISGQSPLSRNESPSPATTTNVESPPKDSQQARLGKGKLPAGKVGLKREPSRSKLGEGSKDSPGPMGVIDEGGNDVLQTLESLKRKREAEELEAGLEADPDGYITRTLKGMDRSLTSPPLLPLALTSHLPFSYEPTLPPLDPSFAASKPLSFATYNSVDSHPPSFTTLTTAAPPARPFDFDFFIDSSAHGFEDDLAPTPDLVANAEPSPSSEDEKSPRSTKPLFLAIDLNTAPTDQDKFGPLTGTDSSTRVVEDYSDWLNDGVEDLPTSFSWE